MRILLLFLLFAIVACKPKSGAGDVNYEVINLLPFLDSKKSIALSEIADSISYIRLETNNSCLIGEIKKAKACDNYLFVSDNTPSLFMFDRQGRFIRKIGNIGKGPDEYLNIWDFTISDDGVYIYDDNAIVIAYDFNGKCIHRHSFKPSADKIEVFNKTCLIFYVPKPYYTYSSDNYSVIITDKDGGNMTKLLKRSPEGVTNKTIGSFTGLYSYCDTLSCWEFQENIIYRVPDDKTVTPRYKFTFGKYDIPDDVRNDQNILEQRRTEFTEIGQIAETPKWFFLFGRDRKHMFNILYNKITKEGVRLFYMDNDIDGGYSFWPNGKLSNSEFYFTFHPIMLKDSWKRNADYYKTLSYDNSKHQALKEMVDKATMNDNPWIMVVKLKE